MQDRYLPDVNRMGVLSAAVLLAHALTRLVKTPGFTLTLQLPGFYFAYPLTLSTAMTVIATGLTATGMDWLLRGHPAWPGGRSIEHWLLPALTAFIVGLPLSILVSNTLWWIGFTFSGAILIFVFISEYVTVDPGAPAYPLASAGLTGLSYALFFLFTIALRASGARLFLMMPAVFVSAALVTLRTLHLRLSNRWEFSWALCIGLVCMQLAAGLHYWPLSPIKFGLLLLGPLYALITLAASLAEDLPLRRAVVEPVVILGAAWTAAVLLP
jgi:hypothetical protein